MQKVIDAGSLACSNFKMRWDTVAVLLALLLFVCLAGYNVRSPGLYYDELLFVNAALGGETDMFVYARLGKLPLMLMPYIGALKAWIYYPIFKIFGVTAYSIRWPVVVIGALSLWISYRFVKMTFSRPSAIIFILLAAVEPSTLFHTRLDWGPTTLMMLFRALLLLSLFAWIKTGRPWLVFAVGAVAVFGVFDKVNFIWFVSAVAISLWMLYPNHITAFVRSYWRSTIVLAFLGLMCVAGFVLYTRYYLPLDKELGFLDWGLRWQQLTGLLRMTIGGVGVYEVVIGNGLAMASPQLFVLGFAIVIALMVLVATRRVPGEWRALGFILCFGCFILLQMFFTTKATGPHHAAMIAPLWVLPISVLLGRAFDPGHPTVWVLKGIVMIAIVGVVVSSLSIDMAYWKGFNGPIQPRWDAGSYDLVQVIKANPDRPVICVDWGSGTIIYSLLDGKVNLSDSWPTFNNGLTSVDAEYYEEQLLPHNPIFVVPAEGKETFKATRINFLEIAANRGWKLVKLTEIKGQAGDVLYELYSVMFSPGGIKPADYIHET